MRVRGIFLLYYIDIAYSILQEAPAASAIALRSGDTSSRVGAVESDLREK